MLNIGLARGSIAVAAASLAVLGFTYGDFGPAGLSLPAWLPWRQLWIYGSMLLVLLASAGLFFPRTALASALTIGVYAALWAVLASPPIFSEPLSVGAWYGSCEALTAFAGAWILYAMLRSPSPSAASLAGERGVRIAQVLFGLCCVFYGGSHFVYADYTAAMVPAWLPGRLGFAWFTGFGHVAAGVAIVLGVLPRLGATLEALMMTLFGLLVWLPSFFALPRPKWAGSAHNQWSEVVVNIVLAASAWTVACSLRSRPWAFAARPPAARQPAAH